MARVTIEEVAARSGVSVATVSRALRGLPNVSPATRSRVMRVASDLRYRPDPNASRLAAGKTGTVAVGVTAIPIWYSGQVIAGIEAVLGAAGLELALFLIADRGARRRFLGDPAWLEKRADGVVVVDLVPDRAERDALAGSGLPWVMVGAPCPGVDSVFVDNSAAARTAADHLIELGHRRIGLIAGGPASFAATAPGDRRRGFEDALRDAGIAADGRMERAGNFSALGGHEAMHALLDDDGAPPTALFAMSDEMAMGAMRAASERGVTVPVQMSVVGFDDHDLAFAAGLTTVRQDAVELGATGARLLLDRMEGRGGPPHRVELPTELIVRGSTAPRRR